MTSQISKHGNWRSRMLPIWSEVRSCSLHGCVASPGGSGGWAARAAIGVEERRRDVPDALRAVWTHGRGDDPGILPPARHRHVATGSQRSHGGAESDAATSSDALDVTRRE